MKSFLSSWLLVGLATVLASVPSVGETPLPSSPSVDTHDINVFQHNAQARIVTVVGCCNSPSKIHIGTGEKLLLTQAILTSGGLGPYAHIQAQIFRLENDRIIKLSVALKFNDDYQDFLLIPGDFVEIPSYMK